jgi:hypothetical protein
LAILMNLLIIYLIFRVINYIYKKWIYLD